MTALPVDNFPRGLAENQASTCLWITRGPTTGTYRELQVTTGGIGLPRLEQINRQNRGTVSTPKRYRFNAENGPYPQAICG